MTSSYRITHIEPTSAFTLYHLDSPKQGATAIVFFRAAPAGLEPTLAALFHQRLRFDFETESDGPLGDDPRLRCACRVRAVTLGSG